MSELRMGRGAKVARSPEAKIGLHAAAPPMGTFVSAVRRVATGTKGRCLLADVLRVTGPTMNEFSPEGIMAR